MEKIVGLWMIIGIVCGSFGLNRGCVVSFPKSDDKFQPLIWRNSSYDFVVPVKGAVSLRTGESVTLLCPKSVLEGTRTNITTATCVRNDIFRIGSTQHIFASIRCKSSARGEVAFTNTPCGNYQGKIIDIGYRVSRNNFITLIKVCYDSFHGNPLYAEHELVGQAVKYASNSNYRPSFQVDGTNRNLSPTIAYKQATQKTVFETLLSSKTLADLYVHQNSYLARGHLAPDADFLFAPQQFTTYFYINVCPQWESINGGNWRKLETMVRKFAEKRNETLLVLTGSYATLQLPDVNGNFRNISLDERGHLSVPKFLWKIVYSQRDVEGIAFVAINNPFLKRVTQYDLLCPDVCGTQNWSSSSWKDFKKGFVYCCDVRALKRVVKIIPELPIRGILRG